MTTQPTTGVIGPPARQSRDHRDRPRSWPVPAALVGLSVIPLAAGTLRLVQLGGGPAIIPADQRFAGFPAPLVLHIGGAAVYALVGAFQFVPRIRRNHRTWHRRAGRVLTAAGLLVAGSALWMTLLYSQKPGTGDLLYVFRLMFATSMAACLVLGISAIRRRDITAHRAWMMRAYAIGLGAGTQIFTVGFGGALFGNGEVRGDLAMGAGWVINLAVAEWAIRHSTRPPTAVPPVTKAGASGTARTYELRLDGHIDDHWSTWLDGLVLALHEDGTTTLTGPVADQAQLHGLLTRVRDIGATLLGLRVLGDV